MIDFTTLQGLTIPEGVVTQIADASGRVLWMLNTGGGAVVLEVEKITSDTYAGETTYTGEQFILLDIYPKTNGTVSVTYGGLTKTITDTSGAEEPNAQQVFFGTFNGVTDEVETPASGEVTIEGDLRGVGCGKFKMEKETTITAQCIVNAVELSDIEIIPEDAFFCCFYMTSIDIPDSVTSIGYRAFYRCHSLTSIDIPDSVTSIGESAFESNELLTSVTIGGGVSSIDYGAFRNDDSVTSVTFDNTSGWYVTRTLHGDASTGTAVDVTNAANNATLLTSTYVGYYWYRA